jgi:hypothetical protein
MSHRSFLAWALDTDDQQIVKAIRRMGLEPFFIRCLRVLTWVVAQWSRLVDRWSNPRPQP